VGGTTPTRLRVPPFPATVQYRNGNWKDSLASLHKLKDREGRLDAQGWFLVARNRHRLGQREEVQNAWRQALTWIREQELQAQDNAVRRFQYEMVRPAIEALRREAENLLKENQQAAPSGGATNPVQREQVDNTAPMRNPLASIGVAPATFADAHPPGRHFIAQGVGGSVAQCKLMTRHAASPASPTGLLAGDAGWPCGRWTRSNP
jgi:hypothetical protein